MASAGDELVQVAYANDPVEAEMIQGLLGGADIPSLLQPAGLNGAQVLSLAGLRPGYGGGTQRVMVRASQAGKAAALLAETMVEDEEASWPEIANAKNLEGAGVGRSRRYGAVGAYARFYLFSLAAMGVIFGVFVLLRAV
jgi:hypothetical protein